MSKRSLIEFDECYSAQNEESYEENYEEMISSYLSQRHIYSASLPLPSSTDSMIDQIRFENSQRQIMKEALKFQLKQQILSIMKPTPMKIDIEKRLTLESPVNPAENMVEIQEVTSSAEQSPTGVKSIDANIEFCYFDCLDTDEFSEPSIDISQEIK
jgi:hypothetical protein